MSAVVADVFRAYRFVRLGRGPPSVRATLAGAVVASAAGLLVAGVGPSAVGVAAAGALVGGALVRVLPGVVAAAGRRGALVARLAVEAGLAGDGGLVARAAARRRVRRDLRRELAAELQRGADARELVAEYQAELFEALEAGIRRVLPGVVAAAGRRGALVARLAVEAGLAGDGGLVARAAARRRVRRDLRRELAAELQRVADARELVAEYRAQLFEALDAGIRWVLHPPDGTSRTRDE